jgi:hypothetical protein
MTNKRRPKPSDDSEKLRRFLNENSNDEPGTMSRSESILQKIRARQQSEVDTDWHKFLIHNEYGNTDPSIASDAKPTDINSVNNAMGLFEYIRNHLLSEPDPVNRVVLAEGFIRSILLHMPDTVAMEIWQDLEDQ